MSVQTPKIFDVKPNLHGVKTPKSEPVEETEDLDDIKSKLFEGQTKTKEESSDESGKVKIGGIYFSTTIIYIFAFIIVVLVVLIVYLYISHTNNKEEEELIKSKLQRHPPPQQLQRQPPHPPPQKPSTEEIKRSNEILDDMLHKIEANNKEDQSNDLVPLVENPKPTTIYIEEIKSADQDVVEPVKGTQSAQAAKAAKSDDEEMSKLEKMFHGRINEEAAEYIE